MGAASTDRLTYAGFGAVVVLIGLNFIAVRVSNFELAPLWGAASRYLVATLIVWALMWLRGVGFPRGHAFWGSALFGTLNFAVFFGLMYWALVEVPAGMGSTILAAVPLATYLMALSLRMEPFRWSALVGASVVILGIGSITIEGMEADVPLLRLLAVVAAVLAAAAAGIVVKRTPGVHPLAMNGVGMAAGALLLLVATLLAGEPWAVPQQTPVQIAWGYLVLSTVVLFVLLVWVIGRWTASKVAYATVLAPIVTIAVGHFVLGEPIGGRFLLGGALVVLGVYWGALRHGRPSLATAMPAHLPEARAPR